MRLNTRKRKAIALTAVALVLVFLYGVIRLIIMGASLGSTYDELKKVQASSSDFNSVAGSLAKAVNASAAAASAADDPIVQTWNWIPFIGSDFAALGTVSRDGHKILQAAEQVFNYTNNLKQAKGKLNANTVAALRDSVVSLNDSLQTANGDFAGIKPADLHFGLADKVTTAKALISKTASAMNVATPMVKIGAALIGAQGTQHWFIATQNLAEARAQGGIIGAYAIVTVNNGKISLSRFGSDVELLGMGPINFSSYPQELRELWGVNLADWRDINASANAPYAGQLVFDGWKQHTGQSLDGVIFVGQGTVAHLAAAGGDINVRGNALNENNIVDFLTKGIYAKYSDVGTKNAVVTEVMKALFSNLTTKKVDTNAFFASLANEKTGDRLVAWSSHKDVEQSFTEQGVAGVVSTHMGPNALVTVNNAGGNKLEAYAHLTATYDQGKCGAVTFEGYYARESQIVVNVTNAAPKSGLPAYVTPRLDQDFGLAPRPKGSNRELISIYGPVGSNDNGFFVNGKSYFASAGVDRGHPVWVFDIELQPGETKQLKVKFLEPIADQNAELLKGQPTLTPPIMLNPARVFVNAGPQCSVKK